MVALVVPGVPPPKLKFPPAGGAPLFKVKAGVAVTIVVLVVPIRGPKTLVGKLIVDEVIPGRDAPLAP